MLPLPAELQPLPSWPAAPDTTVMDALMLFVFYPLGIAVVMAAVIMGPHWARRRSTES